MVNRRWDQAVRPLPGQPPNGPIDPEQRQRGNEMDFSCVFNIYRVRRVENATRRQGSRKTVDQYGNE